MSLRLVVKSIQRFHRYVFPLKKSREVASKAAVFPDKEGCERFSRILRRLRNFWLKQERRKGIRTTKSICRKSTIGREGSGVKFLTGTTDSISRFSAPRKRASFNPRGAVSPETINVTSPPEIESGEHGSEFSRRSCCEASRLAANINNSAGSSCFSFFRRETRRAETRDVAVIKREDGRGKFALTRARTERESPRNDAQRKFVLSF